MNFRRTARVLAGTAVAVTVGFAGTLATAGPAAAAAAPGQVSNGCEQVGSIDRLVVTRGTTSTTKTTFAKHTSGDAAGQPIAARVFLAEPSGAPLVKPGDKVALTFTTKPGCTTLPWTLAVYHAWAGMTPEDFLTSQRLADFQTIENVPGSTQKTLTVTVPATASLAATCSNKHLTSGQTYNGNGGSAASGNQYASTCSDSVASGNGGGNSNTKHCAGCVGNADNKNPKGQRPNGSDPNAGYECDRNNGVGKGNPAHSACQPTLFQIDLHQGLAVTRVPATGHVSNQAYYANF